MAVDTVAGRQHWDRAISGWRSDFMPAPAQVHSQRSDLQALVGRQLRTGWTGWDPARNAWQPAIPLVLAFESGVQLEVAWQAWDDLSITWSTIDLKRPPTFFDRPHKWRSSQPHRLAAVAGRVLTGWAVTESPYFHGDADLTGDLPMDAVAGWSTQGLWLQFAGVGLHVYNAADANGISNEPVRPCDAGHTRVAHPNPSETRA